MSRLIAPLHSSVTAGEFSPEMEGQVSYDKFPLSARILENVIPLATGAFTKRCGFRMLIPQKYDDHPVRLLKFEYSTIQPYAVEVGANGETGGYFRFIKNREQISVAAPGTAITNGTFDSDISGWTDESGSGSISHDSTNGRLALNAGAGAAAAEQEVTGATANQEYVIAFRVVGSAYDKVTLSVGSTSGGTEYLEFEAGTGWHGMAFTPTGTNFFVRFTADDGKTVHIDDVALLSGAMEIGGPYTVSDQRQIKFAQSADVYYIATGARRFHRLERRGHTSWSCREFPFQDGPYLEENIETGRTLQPSHTNGKSRTLTAAGFSPFAATDIGRLVRIKHSSTWGWAVIVGFTSATQVTIDIHSDFGAATAVSTWRLGMFSDTDGHPEAVALFQQRIALSGGGALSSRIDGSATSDFENFAPGTEDDDAYSYLISDGGVNSAQWISSLGQMVVGTTSANFRVMGETEEGAITPTKVKVRPENRDASEPLQPVQLSNVLITVDRHGRSVRGVSYSFEANGLVGTDLTRLAEHVTESGVRDMSFQKDPWETVWFARNDGDLIGLIFAPNERIIGWHRHPVRYGLDAVESVCAVPGQREDDLYISVKRTIGGVEKRFIEVMAQKPRNDDDPQQAMFYMDCGLLLDNAPDATLTPSAVNGSGVTFTASAAAFSDDDIGQTIRYRYRKRNVLGKRPSVIWATAKATIIARASGTEVTADIVDGFEWPSTAACPSGRWRVTVPSVSGADHLIGETVHLVGDGGYLGTAVVDESGAVELPSPSACVHLGMSYDSVYLPQRVEGGSSEGSMQGNIQRPFEVILGLINTPYCQIGQSADDLEDVILRNYADPMDEPLEFFSGDKKLSFNGTNTTDGDVLVVQRLPLPMTVVLMKTRRLVSEKGA